jgi:hypothetical protein
MAARKRHVKPTKTPAAPARARAKVPARTAPRKTVRHEVEIDEPAPRVEGEAAVKDPPRLDSVGRELGEEFVENLTGADDAATEDRAANTTEEQGGPFLITSAVQEFAEGVDASNPAGAKREPFPTAMKPPK